jgi:peroxiredoxin
VLGVTVDLNDANKAWVEKMGVTYLVLSDRERVVTKAYGILNDDSQLLEDPKTILLYMRRKRSWFIIDKAGLIRFVKTTEPTVVIPNDELLKVLSTAHHEQLCKLA